MIELSIPSSRLITRDYPLFLLVCRLQAADERSGMPSHREASTTRVKSIANRRWLSNRRLSFRVCVKPHHQTGAKALVASVQIRCREHPLYTLKVCSTSQGMNFISLLIPCFLFGSFTLYIQHQQSFQSGERDRAPRELKARRMSWSESAPSKSDCALENRVSTDSRLGYNE